MNTTVSLLSSAFLGLTLLTVCGCAGGSSNTEEVKDLLPAPPKVSYSVVQAIEGPLAGYMEAVPGNYELELIKETTGISCGYEGTISIKFRFVKSLDVPQGTGYNHYGPMLEGKLLDQQGRPLEMGLHFGDMSELAAYLKRGTGEEWLKFKYFGSTAIDTYQKSEDEIKENIDVYLSQIEKSKQIRILSKIISERFEDQSTTSSESSVTESESASTSMSVGFRDCDEFLKQYEEFIVEYVKVLKKYKDSPSDMSIMADYTRLMTKAGEWKDYPNDCADDAAFVAKYTEMTMRINQAAM